ncbi:TIGR02678 family protein [Rhodococcus sp. HM1]|uniref:TIGR02678 family protein n=1 Tax=Rhodococcus sp. HM1 TaxID=2937759 RepID=UPI00200A5501|nr:TIGR02678 family protein [Rhodococcus sp. HM1]MCK8672507.1 TIGR02678 family protein [Rhodococcus sp. HM1]
MKARSIPSLELDSFQRAVRLILTHHLVTVSYPDPNALPLVRRRATELRADLLEAFGYRLEVTETTARLFTVADRLDPGAGTSTVSDRPFDRRRYAYLALALAALGRAGNQISLSELAGHVAAEASQVDGVELAADRAADRDAFVDAVAWLCTRGAITLADGDAGRWASDPEVGEALYDIDRAVVTALFRPPRVLQHLRSVRGLLADGGVPADPERPVATAEVARRVRRALVQRPVLYAEELDDAEALQLALPRTAADVELLTGLVAERRAEGVALVDSSGRLSDLRFPGTGSVAQLALLLAGEISARVLDAGVPEDGDAGLLRMPLPPDGHEALVAAVDAAIPAAGVFAALAVEDGAGSGSDPAPEPAEERPAALHPLIEDGWLASTVGQLVDAYGRTFAAQWQADPAGLAAAALDLLEKLRLVVRVPGGVLALPALARYRGVTVTVRERDPQIDLYPGDSSEAELS